MMSVFIAEERLRSDIESEDEDTGDEDIIAFSSSVCWLALN
jgi:hypothetical protein